MAAVTYYVVQPFVRDRRTWRPGEARQFPDRSTAQRIAERFKAQNTPVVAFARSGDPKLGEWDDAEIIASFNVPAGFMGEGPSM